MAESVEHHKDPSQAWLIFFFACFGLVVLAIGVYALFNYHVDAPPAPATGGHGMMLPVDGEYAPHANVLRIS